MIAVVCSLAVQSSRSLLFLGCFSSFGFDPSLWSGVGWICLQILQVTFSFQSFTKWSTLRQLSHILLLRTNLFFFLSSDRVWNPSHLYMKWFSLHKWHFICHEVWASELLSLGTLWLSLIWDVLHLVCL